MVCFGSCRPSVNFGCEAVTKRNQLLHRIQFSLPSSHEPTASNPSPIQNFPQVSAFLVPEEVARFRGFGGVRLEDDVVVTKDGVRNLTNCARTVEDVEAVMDGRITHRDQLLKKHYADGA